MTVFFAPAEWLCKCGRPECDALKAPVPVLASKLDTLRERYGRPIVIDSGLRCAWWNERQGGVADSEHLTGEGVDIACIGSDTRWQLLNAILKSPLLFTRVGVGPAFLHLGVSPRHDQRVVWLYPKKEGSQ